MGQARENWIKGPVPHDYSLFSGLGLEWVLDVLRLVAAENTGPLKNRGFKPILDQLNGQAAPN